MNVDEFDWRHISNNVAGAEGRLYLNLFVVVEQGIAIKSGKDWSGRMVNISTTNVLAEQNVFLKGHGVSIGKFNIDRD